MEIEETEEEVRGKCLNCGEDSILLSLSSPFCSEECAAVFAEELNSDVI